MHVPRNLGSDARPTCAGGVARKMPGDLALNPFAHPNQCNEDLASPKTIRNNLAQGNTIANAHCTLVVGRFEIGAALRRHLVRLLTGVLATTT